MNTTWAQFRSDKYFLTKYFLLHCLVLSGLILCSTSGNRINFDLILRWEYALLLPLCFFAGIQIPVLMHNCTHGNFKSESFNSIVGELTAFFCLMSLGIVRINHTLHHAFSDTHEDPHSPGQRSFFRFFIQSQFTGAGIIEKKFLEFHGRTFANVALFKLNRALHYGSYGLRLLAWYLILGPELFFFFYVPSFLVFSFGFAHVNYITHSHKEDGNVQILNKNDTLYYRFVNFIGSGIYFHLNHHKNPKLVNPMHLAMRSRPPYAMRFDDKRESL